MDPSSNSTHREYNFERRTLLKPKGLVLQNYPPMMLNTSVLVGFYQLDITRGFWKEGASMEESPPLK